MVSDVLVEYWLILGQNSPPSSKFFRDKNEVNDNEGLFAGIDYKFQSQKCFCDLIISHLQKLLEGINYYQKREICSD